MSKIMYSHIDKFLSLLRDCIKNQNLRQGKLIHSQLIGRGYAFTDILGNRLLNLYVKCMDMDSANTLFNQMKPTRDIVSWTTMISAHSKSQKPGISIQLFDQLTRETDLKPTKFTYTSLIKAIAKLGLVDYGLRVHQDIENLGLHKELFVGNCLVDMYGKFGKMEDARQVFDKMSSRDIVSWTALIGGYASSGHCNEAIEIFCSVPSKDVWVWNVLIGGLAKSGYYEEALSIGVECDMPNELTFVSLLSACSELSCKKEGRKLHCRVFVRGFVRVLIIQNGLIDMYAKSGEITEARQVFDEMSKKDIFSWTSIISGYAQGNYCEEALVLFRELQHSGVHPDGQAFACVLPACARLGALEQGVDIHREIDRLGIRYDGYVSSAVMDMYAKCGSLEKALEVFNGLPERDVMSWTTMISAYASHGHGEKAVELFENMVKSGCKPNKVTLMCVLSACCHSGLVDQGLYYFYSMKEHFGIVPTMDHYSCIVDLYGRAGFLDRAAEFIRTMPAEPDICVWNSLLGACRLHSNAEMGKYAAERILELNPDDESAHVLLSSIYASSGRWEELQGVRQSMKSREIVKTPGCSWIEIDQHVHAFVVGD